jgi:peroxiredoxin family protein
MEVVVLTKKMAILASKGGMFDAYKVFNLASAAAAMDTEVMIFFAFDGIQLIHKEMMENLPVPNNKKDMEEALAKGNVPTIPELVNMVKDLGVKMIACQMTMDLYAIQLKDLVDGVETAGAVTFLDYALDADVTFSF